MSIREYLKDKSGCIFCYIISVIFFGLVLVLDGLKQGIYLKLSSFLYGVFLSSIFILIYLVLDYKKTNRFISILKSGKINEENVEYIFNLPDKISNEYDYIKDSYIRNYKFYISNLEKYKENNDIHLKFNNRWIHEMKTPISVIKLLLESESTRNLDEENIMLHRSIEEEIQKLSTGLEMAMYTLRINDFKEDFKVEKVDLLKLTRDLINENRSLFILNEVYPKVLFSEEIIVTSDKKWLRFVIKQIIVNSIKYTKIGKNNKKEIQVEVKKEEDRVYYIIKDTGIGIAKGDLNRIFEPFFTGKLGRKHYESTGMGLYLSKVILDKLGHSILVSSTLNKGSEFKIIFYEGGSIYNL